MSWTSWDIGLAWAAGGLVAVAAEPCRGAVSANLLRNPSFEEGGGKRGVPVGWSLYGGGKAPRLALAPCRSSRDGGHSEHTGEHKCARHL